METLPHEERMRLAASLNWDYEIDASELLEVIDGLTPKAGPFDAQRVLVRSLERLSWHRIVALWGIERLLAIYDLHAICRNHAFSWASITEEARSKEAGVEIQK
jgi:hypothetical protein